MANLNLKHIHLIVNPASGMVEPILPTVNEVWTTAGLSYEVLVTQPGQDGTTLAHTAVADNAELIAVYGGDGTVREVASVLAGGDIPLAVLPGGTTNVVAQQLGVPLNLKAAAQLITAPTSLVKHIDMGTINDDHRFLLRATIGLTTKMIADTSAQDKERFGRGAYILSFLRQLPQMTGDEYTLYLDDETVTLRGVMCIIANCGEVGVFDLRWAAGAEIDDGLLDVIVVGEQATALATAAINLLGQQTVEPKSPTQPLLPEEHIHHWRVKRVRVETATAVALQIDGDLLDLKTPVTVTIDHQTLPVLVPRASA
ncbi:MAG: diacylglycerol kinase family lipid kinase [Anaerolineales bacterium]|nr:diacylglycerol kinase family lipid kinase [Anaerolineales bacterium]